MWHGLVYRSSEIVDFGRPDYRKHYFGNIHVPIYRSEGLDRTDRELLLGMPIYASAPRFQVDSRYFDDDSLRDYCVEFVAKNGGASFFEEKNWRRTLGQVVNRYRRSNVIKESFETPEQRDKEAMTELRLAKEAIEARLDGKRVEHFCFPWYKGAEFAHKCAWETGHQLVYTDYERDFLENVPGSRQRQVARIDEFFLRRLPGAGRISKFNIVEEILGLRNLPGRMFPGLAQ
jgi:hypothetical protein